MFFEINELRAFVPGPSASPMGLAPYLLITSHK